MATITLRPFGPDAPPTLEGWSEHDRAGLEAVMGVPLPDALDCTMAFNTLFQAQQEGRTIFLMADCDDRSVGFTILSDVTPAGDAGRPHIYVVPAERRHSFTVAKEGEAVAKKLGVRHLMVSINPENRRSRLFAKRLGYETVPHLILRKELQ